LKCLLEAVSKPQIRFQGKAQADRESAVPPQAGASDGGLKPPLIKDKENAVHIWMTLQKALDLYPEKIGVIDAERTLTYRQIGKRVAALGGFFKHQGIEAKDCISILDVNSHAFFEAYYAAAAIGAILNPLNYRLSAKEVAYILKDAGSRWLMAAARFAPLVKGALAEGVPLEGIIWIGDVPDESFLIPCHVYETAVGALDRNFQPVSVDEHQVAHLYYTSGTTGRPKGVMLTHKNVCSHALGTIAAERYRYLGPCCAHVPSG